MLSDAFSKSDAIATGLFETQNTLDEELSDYPLNQWSNAFELCQLRDTCSSPNLNDCI